jgi:hypothetical protein
MAMGLPTAVGGDEHEEMASEAAMEGKSHYVIKVTPTLVYLDAGSEAGAHGDQSFVIIREHEGMYVPVGHVTLIRVYESFSIAEINSIATGEEISVLDRVVMADEWERMAPEMESMAAAERRRDPAGGRRSLVLLGGADLGKDVDLLFAGSRLAGVDGVGGGGIGVRLTRAFGRHWRFGVSYRLSGDPLSANADVTQLSIEIDTHLLLRGVGRTGPYLGVGVGLHQLSWDSPANVDDTTYKAGYNAMGGLEIVGATGAWSLLLEGGTSR